MDDLFLTKEIIDKKLNYSTRNLPHLSHDLWTSSHSVPRTILHLIITNKGRLITRRHVAYH